jgi:hypothetical protein
MNNRVKIIFKVVIIALFVLSFSAYGLYKSKGLISGPQITIDSPTNGSTVANSNTEIIGKVKNVAAVFLNGNQIFTNEKGEFKEGLLLASGYNIIVINAKDKFGRETKETREVVIR